MATEIKKIIVSITGTSGAIYGIRLLEILRRCGVETHLIISKSAIASGLENNLIMRSASVVIKEQKKLALIVRAPPLVLFI